MQCAQVPVGAGPSSGPTGKMLHGGRGLSVQPPRLTARRRHQLPAQSGHHLPPPQGGGHQPPPQHRAVPAHGDARGESPVCQGSNIHGTDTGYRERHLWSECDGMGAVSLPLRQLPGGAHGTEPRASNMPLAQLLASCTQDPLPALAVPTQSSPAPTPQPLLVKGHCRLW